MLPAAATPTPATHTARPFRAGVVKPAPPPLHRVQAPPGYHSLLILPGFCNAATDYTAPAGGGEALVDVLESRGFTASTPPIARSDWLRVAACALDPAYWRSEACVSRAYGWYLTAVADAVASAASTSPSGRVVLVGHSAGGWLARALIGREAGVRSSVAGLVSLGTPHAPPSPDAGARCPTGGALAAICDAFPGAYFSSEGLRYVAVAGLAVRGDADAPRGSAARAAAGAYATVSGSPSGHGVLGDGVVPAAVAGLPGAVNLALPGVFHAQARAGGRGRGGRAAAERRAKAQQQGGDAGSTSSSSSSPTSGRLPWYGSGEVVDAWLGALTEAG